MSIRPLAILDLPYLYSFRDEAVGLDTARALTRGNPLGAIGLLSYVNPAWHIYSAIANGEKDSILGGITHVPDETFANLYYLAPSSQLDHPYLPDLIENLSEHAGTWGAFHVLAEVDETNNAFVSLRKAGFSVYAWQRMWDVSGIVEAGSGSDWERVGSVDLPLVQNLYHQIVPPLLHPIESLPKSPLGWMSNDGALCYAGVAHGMYGIVLTPFIHPDATDVSEKLSALISNLPDRRNRPMYICVRSYQAWLEPVLEDLGAKAAERQAVMVKHLVHMVKDAALARKTQPAGVSVQPSRVSKVEGKK
ncbi:MAG TPA: hypothetical protein VIS72_00885 [Anaerolineales bacterium]